MKLVFIFAIFLLTGCTTVPVGSVALCVGVCRFEIATTPQQSPAATIGSGLAELITQQLSGDGK